MKKITLFLILSMVIVFSAEAHKYKNRNSQVTISIQTFYDQLSPYGDWIYSPDNGYVWRPYFDNPESFRPYSSNGNWVYTDYGWTWASDYDWGWATFHYGRWDFDNYLGWTWIPGYEWAPAWVTWGSYDNYWGWAPMGPNIYVQTNSNWYAPDPWWTFVPQNRFCSSNWNRYIYDRPVHVNNITYITNVYVDGNDHDNYNNHNNHNSWYNGPRVNDVERYSRSKVQRMQVTESQRPERTSVRNNSLNVYRPAVDSKRKDYRPTEYRNVEQARNGQRIEQTNARTNDPGANRSRENRSENRNVSPKPVQRSDNSSRETRVESRNSSQTPNQRTTEAARNSNGTNRPYTQPESRNGSVNKQAPVEQQGRSQASPERNSNGNNRPYTQPESRNGSVNKQAPVEQQGRSQASPDRNSNRQSAGNQNEATDRSSRPNVTEGYRTIQNTNRVDNTDNRQTRSSAPARENANNNSSRQSQQKQAPAAQPTREQRTQNAPSSSNSRTENTERKQTTKEQVREAVQKSADESPVKSSGRPNR